MHPPLQKVTTTAWYASENLKCGMHLHTPRAFTVMQVTMKRAESLVQGIKWTLAVGRKKMIALISILQLTRSIIDSFTAFVAPGADSCLDLKYWARKTNNVMLSARL